MANQGFSSQDVTRITAISQRQLQYWCKTALITPSMQTPGGHARFSFCDLVTLKTISTLIRAGVSTQKVRHCINKLVQLLPEVQYPLSELSIVANGETILVFHQGSAFEVISGQEWIIDIAKLDKQVKNSQRELQNYQHDLFLDLENNINNIRGFKQ
ncbi:MAG: MerR family transcriptional regulator [Gammaproteobacteria bacterium]